jgi:hypothetical protein
MVVPPEIAAAVGGDSWQNIFAGHFYRTERYSVQGT